MIHSFRVTNYAIFLARTTQSASSVDIIIVISSSVFILNTMQKCIRRKSKNASAGKRRGGIDRLTALRVQLPWESRRIVWMQLSHHELHILHYNVDSITRRYSYVPTLLWLLFFFFLASSCSNGQSGKLYPCAYIIIDRSHGGNIVRVGTRFTILSHHLPLFLPPFLAIECSIKFSRWRRNRRLQWSMEKLCQIKVIYKHRRVTLTTSNASTFLREVCKRNGNNFRRALGKC